MDVFVDLMSPLKRSLIEKSGHDHGFEHVQTASNGVLKMGSDQHPVQVAVSLLQHGYAVALVQRPPTLLPELATHRDRCDDV